MKTHFWSGCLLVAAFAVSSIQSVVLTQSAPNFSGKWTPIPGRAQPDYLPAGSSLTITQDSKTIAIRLGNGPTLTYRLDGESTRREEKEAGLTRTLISRAAWADSKLTITEERQGWKRELTYWLDADRQSELSIKSSTTLLHTRNGALTVSTIGPWTRVYRKAERSIIP